MVILHVITGLGSGGAENMLYRHIKALDGFQHIVVSLSSSGHYGQKFNDLGVLCYSLNQRRHIFSFIRILIRIIYLIRVHRISMIHSWLYHADFVSSLVSLVCHLPVIWHIHNSKICTPGFTSLSSFILYLNSLLSHYIPTAIVYCSPSARDYHQSIGFSRNVHSPVILNGFSLPSLGSSFRIKPSNSTSIADSVVFGYLGRHNRVRIFLD